MYEIHYNNIAKEMPLGEKMAMIVLLKEFRDVFGWSYEDMRLDEFDCKICMLVHNSSIENLSLKVLDERKVIMK